MKKFVVSAIILVLFGLSLTSLQVYASPNVDQGGPQKTPVMKETEKAVQFPAEKPGGKPEDKSKPDDKGGKKSNVKGVVTAVIADKSLTVTLKDGTIQTFELNSSTQIKIPGAKKGNTDIVVGMQVMVQAVKGQGETLTARHVMVIPGKPAPVHRVGTVTAYAAGVSITIKAQQDGNSYTFKLSQQTKILPENRAVQLKAGSRVTIISSRDVTGGPLSAQGIVVHPADSGPK
jgi:hypothetical protein